MAALSYKEPNFFSSRNLNHKRKQAGTEDADSNINFISNPSALKSYYFSLIPINRIDSDAYSRERFKTSINLRKLDNTRDYRYAQTDPDASRDQSTCFNYTTSHFSIKKCNNKSIHGPQCPTLNNISHELFRAQSEVLAQSQNIFSNTSPHNIARKSDKRKSAFYARTSIQKNLSNSYALDTYSTHNQIKTDVEQSNGSKR